MEEKSRVDKWLEKNISIVTRAANLGDYEMPEGYSLSNIAQGKWVVPIFIAMQIACMFLAGKIKSYRDERVKEEADFEMRMREKYSNFSQANVVEP